MSACTHPCCRTDQGYCQCRGCTAEWCYPRNADGTAAPTCRNAKARGHHAFPQGQQFCKFCKNELIATNEASAKAAAKAKAKAKAAIAKATPAPAASAPAAPAPTQEPAGAPGLSQTAMPGLAGTPGTASGSQPAYEATVHQVVNLTGRMQAVEGRQAAHEQFVREQFEMLWAMRYQANPMAQVLGNRTAQPVVGDNTAALSDTDVVSNATVRGSSISEVTPTAPNGSAANASGDNGEDNSGCSTDEQSWVNARPDQWQ